jgi:hypothetical protein
MNLQEKVLDDTGKVAEQKYKKVVVDKDGKEVEKLFSQPITLGRVIKDCMMLQIEGEITDEEVLIRGVIYDKVDNDEEFSGKEIDFIKGLISKRYTPLFRWQLLRFLK